MDFVTVQKEIEVHFWGLLLAAGLFILGISAYIYNFIRHGKPVAEVQGGGDSGASPPAAEAA